MAKIVQDYNFNVPGRKLFDCFLQKVNGDSFFHIEEADRVDLTIKLEKGTFWSLILGIRKQIVYLDFDLEKDSTILHIIVKGPSGLQTKIEKYLQSCVNTLPTLNKADDAGKNAPDKDYKYIKEIIQREIVRIPCPYCSSLVDNTLTKCPHCGGDLKWS
ncbi:MAG: hypothetical protein PF689_04725 [Deltaproteobacteria bacterium]|nr:hypothetical protein [Deltaproteobacteria bacterium]